MLPATRPCVPDATSLVTLLAPGSLFSSPVQTPVQVSSQKSWTCMTFPCSEASHGSPVPRRGILLAFKAPQHLVPTYPSNLTFLFSLTEPSDPAYTSLL